MKVTLRIAMCATLLRAGMALAAAPPSTSLDTCQNTVRSAGGTFLKNKVAAIEGCLKAVSGDIIKNSQAISEDTATLCAKRFRQIYDSRSKGVSLDEIKTKAILKKCEPGMPMVTHNINDITGNGGGNAPSPGIDTNNLSAFCGFIGEVQDWINCIDYAHDCAAGLAIATEYPRALPWLNLVKGAIMSLPVPAKDPTFNSDAVIGLQKVVDRIDGSPVDGTADIICGPIAGSSSSSFVFVDLPCQGDIDGMNCYTSTSDVQSATLAGAPGALYDVALHFSGTVELKTYTGGTTDGFWNVGGTPGSDPFNVYKLEVSDPAQTYYLNAGVSGVESCSDIDYVRTVRAATGATLTLTALSVDDREVEAVDFNQFIDMDVNSVKFVP